MKYVNPPDSFLQDELGKDCHHYGELVLLFFNSSKVNFRKYITFIRLEKCHEQHLTGWVKPGPIHTEQCFLSCFFFYFYPWHPHENDVLGAPTLYFSNQVFLVYLNTTITFSC